MKRLTVFFILLLVLAVPTSAALAAPYFDTIVEEGETINNDVIVFDGDLEIDDGATVNGDVIVFNGDAQLDGTINGDLVIFNGDLDTAGEARISGDCVLLNGDVEDDSNGNIRCTLVQGQDFPALFNEIPAIPPIPAVPGLSEEPNTTGSPDSLDRGHRDDYGDNWSQHDRSMGFFASLMAGIGSSIFMALMAFGVASVFPNQLQQVQTTVRQKPMASGAVGLLTAVAVPSLVVLLLLISAVLIIVCVGLLGFPLAFLIMLGLLGAGLMGWIAVGSWLGQKLFRGKGRNFAIVAALGTFVLTLGLHVLGLIPFMFGETILALIISWIGLGAVALTKFGSRPYPPQSQSTSAPPMQEDEDKVTAVLETLHIDEDDLTSKG